MARIGITLDEETFAKFKVLSIIEGKKPSTLATDLVKGYIDSCGNELDDKLVDELIKAQTNYDESIAKVRARIRAKSTNEK